MRTRGSLPRAGYQVYLSADLQPSLDSVFVAHRNQYSREYSYDQDDGRSLHLVRLVADEGDDHAVQVEEEHQQVETQLDERFLARCQLESLQIEAWKGK